MMVVFLLPVSTEIIHTYQHSNDTHCPEHSIIHFHETEHHCSICDYVPLTADKSDLIQISFSYTAGAEIIATSYTHVVKSYYLKSPPSRGPPVIS
jgi:hypothetical protein